MAVMGRLLQRQCISACLSHACGKIMHENPLHGRKSLSAPVLEKWTERAFFEKGFHRSWEQQQRGKVTMAALNSEAPENNPGLVANPNEETAGYIMQQTMYRIKDPKISLQFYSNVLGMRLLKKLDFPDMQFTVYFMGYVDPSRIPQDEAERVKWLTQQKGTIELTHNYGTETDPNVKYHNGNSEPRGFGHIGITVPDVYKACERFKSLGVEFAKEPDGGKMKGLAFIKDPDGYLIEIFSGEGLAKLVTS